MYSLFWVQYPVTLFSVPLTIIATVIFMMPCTPNTGALVLVGATPHVLNKSYSGTDRFIHTKYKIHYTKYFALESPLTNLCLQALAYIFIQPISSQLSQSPNILPCPVSYPFPSSLLTLLLRCLPLRLRTIRRASVTSST